MTRSALCVFVSLALSVTLGCNEKPAPTPGTKTAASTASSAAKAPASAAQAAKTAEPAAPAPAPYRPPAVARALPAAHTLAVVGVEGLDWLFLHVQRLQREVLPALPAEALEDTPPQLRDPKFLHTFFNFAPETPSAWQNVGVQPGAGISVAFDDRLRAGTEPVPLLLMQITDRGKFMAFLNGLAVRNGVPEGVTMTGETRGGACEVIKLGDKEACLAPRRGFMALMPLGASKAAHHATLISAFTTVVQDAGPALADDAQFKRTLKTYPGTPAVFHYLDHRKLAEQIAAKDGALPPDAAFYIDRFPASATWLGRRGGGVRVLADAAGVTALRQIFSPTHGAPDVAGLISAGSSVTQLTVNPASLFEGVAALVPPSRGQVKGQILLAKNMLPVATGAAWEDIVAGFSGHVTLTFDIKAPFVSGPANIDQMVVALGVADVAAAKRALAGVQKKLWDGGTETLNGDEVAVFGPMKIMPLFHEEQLLLGTVKAIKATLDAPASDSPPASKATALAVLGEGGFYSFAVPIAPLLATATLPEAQAKAARDGLAKLWPGGAVTGGLGVDDDGLRAVGGSGALVLGGVLAAIAVPAFQKYINRSKAAMARLMVRQMATMAAAYHLEHNGLPPSAPLTPAASPCDGGDDDRSYLPTGETFAHPTWKALNVRIAGKQYYRYAFEAAPGGFTARAVGDLDCDGKQSTFEVVGRVVDGELTIEPDLRITDETE